jgi:SSS family solute:Na+ symporter
VTTAIVAFAYPAVVLYIGIFAFRQSASPNAEDYFLARRSLGQYVFALSLFGTHMTAFAILGSSGHAFHNGIVTYGLMASSSALVVPLVLLYVGTKLWRVGRAFGFLTPVQIFRDRWECRHIGTVICVLQAALLAPYIIIGVIGGGATLSALTAGWIPYWLGGALVSLVVMSYVFFGGMRGTAWVNTFQTALFLGCGLAAFVLIGRRMGGFEEAVRQMLANRELAPLLTRERVSPWFFLSYTLLPLSAIAFPHMAIFCLTARRAALFRKMVVLYPLCLLAIWLPAVFLGLVANRATDVPAIAAKLQARAALVQQGASMRVAERERLRKEMNGDDVLLHLLSHYAPAWLAGVLGAGIMAAVMASDSQILALSTLFTEDMFAFYGGRRRFGDAAQVRMGRLFVILFTAAAYAAAMRIPQAIFDVAVQYAFSGFAALAVLPVAALYWRRSTKWGALAATLWTAGWVLAVAAFQSMVPAPAPGQTITYGVFTRTFTGTLVLGWLPVAPMVTGAAALMVVVSLLTAPASQTTLERYFPSGRRSALKGA